MDIKKTYLVPCKFQAENTNWLVCCSYMYLSHVVENLFMPYVNNKGADQLAHPHSLISAFVVRCLDSIIPLLAISKISRLASFRSLAGWFESYLVANLEDRFSHDEAHSRASQLLC